MVAPRTRAAFFDYVLCLGALSFASFMQRGRVFLARLPLGEATQLSAYARARPPMQQNSAINVAKRPQVYATICVRCRSRAQFQTCVSTRKTQPTQCTRGQGGIPNVCYKVGGDVNQKSRLPWVDKRIRGRRLMRNYSRFFLQGS